MTSIVIAAHNEAAVIGRCLDALLAEAQPGEFDVTVVANGCTDATAEIAAVRTGVRVLDLLEPSKARALNAGDAVAVGFPRIYLDADIVISTADVRALRDALHAEAEPAATPVLAVTPRRELDLSHSPLLVRAFYVINLRLPAFQNALFGRGLVALSANGRARFGQFPDVMADDLFLDSLFAAAEKREVESVSSRIAAPRRTADLVRRLVRVRRGNATLRAQAARTDAPVRVRHADRASWLRDLTLRDPAVLPAAACYATITLLAALLARRQTGPTAAWGRDNSSRTDDLHSGNPKAALDGRG